MSRFPLSSVRSRAIILVLLAVIPLLALTLYSYFSQRDRTIRQVQRDGIVAVRNLATIQETLINKTQQLLMTLSQLPQMQRHDRDAINTIFAALLEQNPHSVSIGAMDSAGHLFASAPTDPGPVNYADRSWFQKIIQTQGFVIDETVLGRISGKYGNILAYPILDSEGRFVGALATQLNLHWLGSLLSKSNLPPTTAMGLTDSTGKVLFRYPDPEKYIGKMLPHSLIKAMTISDEGVAEGVGLPGDARLFAFTRLSPPWQEIRLAIGVPRDWVMGPVNHDLWRNLIWLALVALFAMAATWYGGSLFVVRPVKKLQGVTERLAAGDLSVRAGPDYMGGELGLLAHSFDQMADSLQKREEDLLLTTDKLQQENEERQAAEIALQKERQRLYALLDTLPGIIYLKGKDHSIRFANQGFRQLFGDPQDKKCYEIIANFAEPCPGCPFLDVLKTGIPHQSELTHPTIPRTFQVYDYPFVDYDGANLVLTLAVDITARQRAEMDLRREKDFVAALLQTLGAVVVVIDRDSRIVHVNRACEEVSGYSSRELLGKSCIDLFIPPEEADGVRNELHKLWDTGLPGVYENHWVTQDGERRLFSWSNSILKDDSGQVQNVISTGIDITEHRRAEEALQESEKRFRDVAENAHEWVWEVDAEGKYTYTSPIVEKLLGYKPGEVLEKPFYDLFIPDEREKLREMALATFADKQPFREFVNWNLHKDGSNVCLSTSGVPVFDKNGSFLGYRGADIDITERKNSEEALRESEERFRAIFEQAAVGVGLGDSDTGHFLKINDKYCEIVGLTQEELLATTFMAITHPDDIQADLDNVQKMRQGLIRHFSREKRYIRKDGSIVWVNLTVSNIWKSGKPSNYNIVVVEDINERKRAEEKLRVSEANLHHLASQLLTAQEQERERISRELHDELGQSLLVLKLQAGQIALNLGQSPDRAREDCLEMSANLDRLVDNVRRLSRDLSPTILHDLGLSEALKHVIRNFVHLHNIQADIELPPNLDKLFPREAQLNIYRVFQESLTNIGKYAQASRIEIIIKRERDQVYFKVVDNGKGFNLVRGMRANRSERGLGLAAMEERVRMLNGTLNIWSKKGAGTRISFTVPIRGKEISK